MKTLTNILLIFLLAILVITLHVVSQSMTPIQVITEYWYLITPTLLIPMYLVKVSYFTLLEK